MSENVRELLEDEREDDFDIDESTDESESDSGEEEEDDDEMGDSDEAEDEDSGEVVAEKEIEGDFDRLVQNIRLRNDPSLAKDWDINIEEQEEAFKDDLRAASGIGRRRKGRKRAVGPALSQQVRALIGDGNQAFVDNDLPATIKIMQEVIRIEPRAAPAWSVLAQCYEDMKETDRALQLRIMAAHLQHDAEEWDRLARQSRDLGYHQQALYCYRKVSSLDPSNVDALWDRASLAKEIGDLRIARHSFLAILKRIPHDLTVLSELRPILIELGDLTTCATLFQNAFDYYRSRFPSGQGALSGPPGMGTSSNDVPGGGFSILDILVLADLYTTLDEYDKAVEVIKAGTRWVQGRADQKYWDLFDDDREFDQEGMDTSRRAAAAAGKDAALLAVTASGDIGSGNHPLDINSRHRLAIARIKMGDIDEGIMHANVVLAQDVLDYAALFVEIADAYYERGMYAEARPVYEVLGGDASTSSVYILLQTASCLRMLDELREAAEIYEHVKLADPTNNEAKMKLAEVYEILNEPRKALDLVYQVIDSRRRRAKDPFQTNSANTAAPSSSLFAEERPSKNKAGSRPQNRLTQAQLKELEAEKEKEVKRGYKRLKEIWEPMMAEREAASTAVREGSEVIQKLMEDETGGPEGPYEKEWMLEAEKLVDTFRETRNLFLAGRNNPFRGMFPKKTRTVRKPKDQEADEDRMASRLQLDLHNEKVPRKSAKADGVEIFRGISFKDWLHLIIQYCFILVQRSQHDVADEVLRHILMSNAYTASEYQVSIRLALIACAISSQHYSVVVEQCRKLISSNQFNNEMYRLLMSSLSSGLRPTDCFITSTLQKFLLREMRLSDAAVKNPETLKWNSITKRYAPVAAGKKDKDAADDMADDDSEAGEVVADGNNETSNKKVVLPTKNNPLLVAMYGQMCVAAKSYQSAIFYLLHAYDYCPDDPMICLSLAIASIGRAMQRQSDNRHHLIAQGMAFLSRYRVLRGSEPERLSEVEYNFGRTFHQLGLHSHAVKHYERVLELAESDPSKTGNLSKEAAYNLSLIYVMTGAIPLAEALYRRWLSL